MSSGLDTKKKPGSVDEVIEQKFNILIGLMDARLHDVYKDFNLAMAQKNQEDKRLELTLTNMVNLMWGMLNEQKIRLITLENYLVTKDIILPSDFEEQYLENIAKFKETSGFQEIPLAEVLNQDMVNPLDSVGNLTPQRGDLQDTEGKPF